MNRKKEKPLSPELAEQNLRGVVNKIWRERHHQGAGLPAVELAQAIAALTASAKHRTLNPPPLDGDAVADLEKAAKRARTEHDNYLKRKATEDKAAEQKAAQNAQR